eukprot:1274326-Rhodomonas_salina.1
MREPPSQPIPHMCDSSTQFAGLAAAASGGTGCVETLLDELEVLAMAEVAPGGVPDARIALGVVRYLGEGGGGGARVEEQPGAEAECTRDAAEVKGTPAEGPGLERVQQVWRQDADGGEDQPKDELLLAHMHGRGGGDDESAAHPLVAAHVGALLRQQHEPATQDPEAREPERADQERLAPVVLPREGTGHHAQQSQTADGPEQQHQLDGRRDMRADLDDRCALQRRREARQRPQHPQIPRNVLPRGRDQLPALALTWDRRHQHRGPRARCPLLLLRGDRPRLKRFATAAAQHPKRPHHRHRRRPGRELAGGGGGGGTSGGGGGGGGEGGRAADGVDSEAEERGVEVGALASEGVGVDGGGAEDATRDAEEDADVEGLGERRCDREAGSHNGRRARRHHR